MIITIIIIIIIIINIEIKKKHSDFQKFGTLNSHRLNKLMPSIQKPVIMARILKDKGFSL